MGRTVHYGPKSNGAPLDGQTELGALRVLNEIISRSRMSAALGQSFGGARDLYAVCGYNRSLSFEDFFNAYKRGRLSKRIIHAPVDSTWRGGVRIVELGKPDESEFEIKWNQLSTSLSLISKFIRLDRLAGLGKYSVLLMGFDDSDELSAPLNTNRTSKLLYVQPYSEVSAQIVEWERDVRNERYGLPLIYSIKTRMGDSQQPSVPVRVHHSRILHVAEGLLENEVEGTPRLESCYNSLSDVEKIAAGSAEMFWQGALGGRAFTTREGAELGPEDASAMKAQIDEYVHGLRRYLSLKNMEVKDLAPQATDPTSSLKAQIELISGDTGIPQRILLGSERGELSSMQDENNWLTRVQERREQHAEPSIIRPFVNKLIETKVLPTPAGGFEVKWSNLWAHSDKERADIAKQKAETIRAYLTSPGADQVVPIDVFLTEIMNFTPEQMDAVRRAMEQDFNDIDLIIDDTITQEEAGV